MKNRKLGGVGFSEKDLSVNHRLLCESSIILVGEVSALRCMNRKAVSGVILLCLVAAADAKLKL